jgi:hypothetical protein
MDAMFMWRCAILVKSDVFVLIFHENKSFDLHIFLFLLFTIFAFPVCLFPQFKWYDIKLEKWYFVVSAFFFWPGANSNVTVPVQILGSLELYNFTHRSRKHRHVVLNRHFHT